MDGDGIFLHSLWFYLLTHDLLLRSWANRQSQVHPATLSGNSQRNYILSTPAPSHVCRPSSYRHDPCYIQVDNGSISEDVRPPQQKGETQRNEIQLLEINLVASSRNMTLLRA